MLGRNAKPDEGLTAGLLALPLGWLMGQLLIHVVNERSFGWSMQSLLPPGVLGHRQCLGTQGAHLVQRVDRGDGDQGESR